MKTLDKLLKEMKIPKLEDDSNSMYLFNAYNTIRRLTEQKPLTKERYYGLTIRQPYLVDRYLDLLKNCSENDFRIYF